ncbi:MAG TPA: FtsX-like permease family protein [Dehalococcoidia bacterium]|nr:FtsX-like permease family protein [Dehalococcoidia bacterium]
MSELFGLPMSTLMWAFSIGLGLVVAWSLFLALRQPVLFRLSARNIPRRWGRSLLIVLGLTLATTIITSALATGDTIALSARGEVLGALGNIDEVISSTEESDVEITGEAVALAYFDEADFEPIRRAALESPLVDAVAPAVIEEVGAQNLTRRQTEPRLGVIGVDHRYMDGFGTIRNLQGQAIELSSLKAGEVLLNQEASDELQAVRGDQVMLYSPGSQLLTTVRDVIDYDGIGTAGAGLLIALPEAQALFGKQGQIKHVIISNRGDAVNGARHTDAVIQALNPTLERLGLAVEPTKRDDLKAADEAGALFSTFFLTFGSFSIAAGILLIFLLFVMLAGERKPEMGIARAVGTERIHLVEMFMFEGMLYDVVAAAVGALAGIGVAYLMVWALSAAIQDIGNVDIAFSITSRSLITAYAMGVVLTFIVVTISAWRVSLLNIVTAIRDLPEPFKAGGGRASLVWGAVAVLFGALLVWAGLSAEQATPFSLGVSLLVLSAVPLSRWAGAPDRLAFTVAGLLIVVYWLLPWRWVEAVSGQLSADFNIWITGGLITVTGVTWIVMYNSDIVVRVALATLGRISGVTPTLRTALTYPLTNRFRTGVTMAMFTLVVFTLVIGGTVTTAFTEAFDDVKLFGGGYDVRASTVQLNPITDLEAAIAKTSGLDRDDFGVISGQSLAPVEARQLDTGNLPGDYPLRGLSDSFFDHNAYGMAAIANGYDSPRAVWQALKNDPSLAVVDGLAAPRRDNFNFGPVVPDFKLEGFFVEDGTFDPIPIEVRDPLTGATHRLTIIGVLPDVIPDYMIGVTTSQRFLDAAFPEHAQPIAHLVEVKNPADAARLASELESAFLANGMEAVVLQEELDDLVAVNKTFNYLIQGFIGLGLVVGVAALGVVSARSVVERRQEIGVMRAIGFEQGRVQISFLIESSMVAVAGLTVGTILGLILSYNIIDDSQRQASWQNIKFAVPWLNLAVIYTVVMAAALITAFLPARQASRVYPAQALRYE